MGRTSPFLMGRISRGRSRVFGSPAPQLSPRSQVGKTPPTGEVAAVAPGHEVVWQTDARGGSSLGLTPLEPPAHRGSSPGSPPQSPDCCDSHRSPCPALTHAISWVPALFQSNVQGFFFFMSVYLVSLTNMYTYIFSEVKKCFKLPLSPRGPKPLSPATLWACPQMASGPPPPPTSMTRLNTFKKQERRPRSLFLFTTSFP